MKSDRRIFGFLSHPAVQLKYSFGFALFVSSVILLLNYIFTKYFFLQYLLTNDNDAVSLGAMSERIPYLSSIAIFVVCFIIVFLLLLFITHRFIGPSIRIEQVLIEIMNGNYTTKINLRDEDELKSLADKVNQLSQQLQIKKQ